MPQVGVGGVAERLEPALPEVGLDLGPPDLEQRPHIGAAAGRHPPQAGQAAAAQEVEDHALDQVVGGVGGDDRVGRRLGSSPLEELVSRSPGGRLERSSGERLRATFADQAHPKLVAEGGHPGRVAVRAGTQRVVVVGGDEVPPRVAQGQQQGGRVRSAREGDEEASGRAGSRDPSREGRCGGGWVRTSDAAVMSRVLYH